MLINFHKYLFPLVKKWIYPIVILIVGLLIYSTILIIGIPNPINQIFSIFDSTPLFVALFIPLYLAYRFSGWLGTLLSFNGTLILFALQLSHHWRMGETSGGWTASWWSIGGFLPRGDASFYYQGARNLLEGGLLLYKSSWRPLAQGTLATLLGLTQQNLQITLAILVLINAICAFFLAREIQRTYGTAASVLTLLLIFLYYREYMGTVMTENLGLALGSIGLGILWRGTVKHQMKLCLLAIFVFTLALNIRAGAYFILPLLVLWGAWIFRGNARFSNKFLLRGFSVILLGFIINSLMFKLLSSPDTVANSNFAYTVYGLVVNGKWTTIFEHHPDLQSLGEVERTSKVYELAWQAFLANPITLVQAIFRAYKEFLTDGFIFSYFQGIKIRLMLQILSIIGLIACYRQRKNPIASLILTLTVGILLSVPLVPPWEAWIRPYAVTIPVLALYPALGLSWLIKAVRINDFVTIPEQEQQPKLLATVGCILVLLTVIGPISTKLLSRSPELPNISCPTGSELVYFRHSQGSSLHIVPDSAIKQTYIPKMRISDFKKQQQRNYQRNYKDNNPFVYTVFEELLALEENTTITSKINLQDGSFLWVIADSQLVPEKTGIVAACGQATDNIFAKGNTNMGVSFFYADTLTLVNP